MPGEGGSTDAPPPPSGLGNFKGVMLCNRPSDDSKVVSEAKQPFRSAVAYTSDLGLTPVRNFEPTVKKRGPSAALRRHVDDALIPASLWGRGSLLFWVGDLATAFGHAKISKVSAYQRWLRELQQQMREDRDQAEQEGQDEEEKRQKMKAAFDKHRKAVRDMMKERDDKQKEEAAAAQAEKAAKAAEAKAKATENSVPLSEIAHAAAISAVDRPAPKVSKPLWAMTEQEKDHFEEEEADDLINFVEHLDFDKYVGDLEFRQALGALKDRTGKLKKEQDAFKDELLANFNVSYDDEDEASTAAGSAKLEEGVDGQSIFGDLKSEYSVASSRRSRREDRENGQKDWDHSTNPDERPVVDQEVKDMAEAVLEQNPKFRAIHSGASVQKIIEKVQREPAAEIKLVDHMRLEAPCPVPVITASSDTQTRLFKPVDPSMLPYLYRSPAI
ncbi:unnamed protein product [Durusdinium trenchii]|uniref:Uncharacterized protein n=1 Tax=Durusdinium trenchii TaxID=1381693 RepID=A0ABP0L4X7_9DINO